EHDVHDSNPADKEREAGDKKSHRANGARQTVKHLNDLVLLIDREIIGLIRPEPANASHRNAQFFFGFFELRQVFDFYVDFVIVRIEKGGGKLPERNNGLVINTAAVQKAALFVEHADDFKFGVANRNFLPQWRSALEKIGCDLRPKHANRAAAL